MFSISYNLSASIKAKLAKIDELYSEIMLVPLAPKVEIQLRWQATLSHIEGWASLTNQPLSRERILEIVNHFQSKNVSPEVTKVLNYKNALNYVRENWTANPSEVTFVTIVELAKILDVSYGTRQAVEPLLTYLQAGQMHPVVQAALAHLGFYPNRSAYLSSLLFLAKAGYDLRGLLTLEDCWNQNKVSYLQTLQQATRSLNSTLWIEYFCQAMIVQMTVLESKLKSKAITPIHNITKYLNMRQKAILDFAGQSENPITNRQIQSMFMISQITASRDLAKLSISGLLATHGSGRSTSYTKI